MARFVFTKYQQFEEFFIAYEWGRILASAVDKQNVKSNAQSCPNYFFCIRLRTSCCILPTIFKKPTVLIKIFGLLRIVELRLIARNCSWKKQLAYYSALYFPSYLLTGLSRILPHSKTIQNTIKTCQYLVKWLLPFIQLFTNSYFMKL